MLTDIKEVMSMHPGARLLLYETIRGGTNLPNVCRGAMTREELLALLERNEFALTRELRCNDSISWFEFKVKDR